MSTHPLASDATLDVSGNVKANGIVVGGSTAKQIDCGPITATAGLTTVYFNFTFTNQPIVTCTQVGPWSTSFVICTIIETITTTYFTFRQLYYNDSFGNATYSTNWIAIGKKTSIATLTSDDATFHKFRVS